MLSTMGSEDAICATFVPVTLLTDTLAEQLFTSVNRGHTGYLARIGLVLLVIYWARFPTRKGFSLRHLVETTLEPILFHALRLFAQNLTVNYIFSFRLMDCNY
jgi:hypothetical protein